MSKDFATLGNKWKSIDNEPGTEDKKKTFQDKIAKGLEDSVEVLNQVGINSQEASALIVITQHYDTLQAMGENSNSNLKCI